VEQNGFPTATSDLLVKEELSADALLAPPNPACPELTVGWAPLTGEGTIPEGNDMIELTSYCGSTRALSPGHSLMGVGLQLNPGFFTGATTADKLVTFANQKLGNLTATVNAANIPDNSVKTALASCVGKTGTYLNDTVNLTAPMRYACAAHQAWTCDNTVNASNFATNPNQLSAYSAIRGRLANLILTINTRLIGQPASSVWPLVDPGLPATSCDPDTTPPDAPLMLAPSSTQTSVTLNWNPSSDNPGGTGLGGYYLYRTGAASSPLATLGPCGPCSYTDSSLTVETPYSYQLVAFDKSTQNNGGPNLSASTASNVATQPDTAAPSTPGSVTLGTVTTTSVALSWSASADPSPGTGVGGYYVYRNGNRIQTVTAGTSFTDNGLSPATAYSYQVAAFDLSKPNVGGPNVSGLSTALPVTTLTPPDTLPPSTPTGLTATYVTSKTLKLSWSASADPAPYASGIGGYYVFLNGTQVGSTTSTTFQITLSTSTSDTQFQTQVAAFDKAAPTPNVSARSSPPLIVTCYDPDHNHDCDSYPSSH
jgi:chitodextrinase